MPVVVVVVVAGGKGEESVLHAGWRTVVVKPSALGYEKRKSDR